MDVLELDIGTLYWPSYRSSEQCCMLPLCLFALMGLVGGDVTRSLPQYEAGLSDAGSMNIEGRV